MLFAILAEQLNLIKLSAASVSFRRVMTAVLTGILKCTRSDASAQVPFTNPSWASLYTITPAIARLLNFLNEKAVLNGKNMLVLLRYETWLMTGLTLSSICMKIGWIWILFVSVFMDITDMHRLMPQGTVPDLPLISIP